MVRSVSTWRGIITGPPSFKRHHDDDDDDDDDDNIVNIRFIYIKISDSIAEEC